MLLGRVSPSTQLIPRQADAPETNAPQLSHIRLWQDKWQLQSATSEKHNFTVAMATKLERERAQQGLLSQCGLEKDRQREQHWAGKWRNTAAEDFFHSTARVCGLTNTLTHTSDDLNFTPRNIPHCRTIHSVKNPYVPTDVTCISGLKSYWATFFSHLQTHVLKLFTFTVFFYCKFLSHLSCSYLTDTPALPSQGWHTFKVKRARV